jgi:hypothetical protein
VWISPTVRSSHSDVVEKGGELVPFHRLREVAVGAGVDRGRSGVPLMTMIFAWGNLEQIRGISVVAFVSENIRSSRTTSRSWVMRISSSLVMSVSGKTV